MELWYADALRRLGLEYEQVARGERNSIGSWFPKGELEAQSLLQQLILRSSAASAKEFLDVFIRLYNLEIKLGLS